MIRVELDKKHLKLQTFVLLIFLIASIAVLYKLKTEIANAAKVEGEILCTYSEIHEHADGSSYGVAMMSVTYFYNGKRYISDMGITTQLGKPAGKKITIYVNKKDPNIIYNPAMINWMVFFIVVLAFFLISYICVLTKTIVKNRSDTEIRKMISEYDKINSSTNKKQQSITHHLT